LGTVTPKWSTPSTPGIGEWLATLLRACVRSPTARAGVPSATVDSEKISNATALQTAARLAERFPIDPPLVDTAEANALNGLKQEPEQCENLLAEEPAGTSNLTAAAFQKW